MSKKFLGLEIIALSILFGAAISYAAWTEPTATPPNGNVPAPLNVGPDGQSKSGGLILNTGGAVNGLIVDKGNVGIGTANPEQRLHVISPSDQGAIFETFRSEGDGCWTPGVGDGSGCDTEMHFRSARGTPASPAALQNGDEITEWYAVGYDGNSWISDMQLHFAVDGPVSAGNMPTLLNIGKSDADVFFTVRSSGNVGIGTTDPGQKLEVNGGVKLNTTTGRPTCSATTRGTFWFVQGASGVKDSAAVCAKDAANAYAWRTIY